MNWNSFIVDSHKSPAKPKITGIDFKGIHLMLKSYTTKIMFRNE